MKKGEKRNFKLYIQRNSTDERLQVVKLFDALDKMNEYDEQLLLKKIPELAKSQVSNAKAHLYKQLLSSLRLIKDETNIDMQLHEQMDFARILYNKGLYHQSLKLLDKLKETAKEYHQLTFLLQAIQFEKKIETLHITRSMTNRTESLCFENDLLLQQIALVGKLSNLALQMYGWYIAHGHARDQKDVHAIKTFFENSLPFYRLDELGFYEKLYLYQSYCWYGYILQDLLTYYRYTAKWVDMFEENPNMVQVETGQYIRGMHNLMSAHFNLNNYDKFIKTIQQFEEFTDNKASEISENSEIQAFVYLYIAKINKHFLEGTFSEGLGLIPIIEEKLEQYRLHLDKHREMVFFYKIACLYFGSGEISKTIDYLNKIIHGKTNLRTDLQCYARLLHLIAHYELGNYVILEHLIKSVFRFMSKMNNLSIVEEEVFLFIRKSFSLSPQKLIPAFTLLKEKIEKLQDNPLESRSLMYLDIVGWLESKIEGVPVQEIRKRKFLERRKKN